MGSSLTPRAIGIFLEIQLSEQKDLSPEGRCEAYPVGVQLFVLMFYYLYFLS